LDLVTKDAMLIAKEMYPEFDVEDFIIYPTTRFT
jgi:hypothetical protein